MFIYIYEYDEPWADTMRRMRDRVARAMSIFPIEAWSAQLARRKFKMAGRFMARSQDWPSIIVLWDPKSTNPMACRSRGRPQRRWDDYFHEFTSACFPARTGVILLWMLSCGTPKRRLSYQDFLEQCLEFLVLRTFLFSYVRFADQVFRLDRALIDI